MYFHFNEMCFIKNNKKINLIQNKYTRWIISIANTLSVLFLVFYKKPEVFTSLVLANSLCIGIMMFNDIIIGNDYIFYHNKTIKISNIELNPQASLKATRSYTLANTKSDSTLRKLFWGNESGYTILKVSIERKTYQLAIKNEYVELLNSAKEGAIS